MSTVSNNGSISSSVLAAINGTSNAKSTSATKTGAAGGSDNSAEGIQNRFLSLLVTQLQNQDPLNPMDNAQMTTQMAQISTVSGLSQLNISLEGLLSSNTDTQTLQAAGLIGKNVLIAGNNLSLGGGEASGGMNLSGDADSVTVAIKNAAGTTVKTLDLGAQKAGVRTISWDGNTDSGAAAPDGSYTFSVSANQGGKSIAATTLGIGTVSSVARGSGGVSINLGTMGNVGLNSIQQIL